MEPDWSKCPEVERSQDTVSGAWRLKGTRIRVSDILANAIDQTPDQIVKEVYEGLDVDRVRRVIAFAQKGAHASRRSGPQRSNRPTPHPHRP